MAILLIMIVIADFFAAKTLAFFYDNSPFKTTYSISKTTEDLLIFGSSRASNHYVPSSFAETLGITCFNNGYNGQDIYYHYSILESTLSRYNPKIIIYDISNWDFRKDKRDTESLSLILPNYSDLNDSIKKLIEEMGPYEKYKLWSHCYPYNSMIIRIAECYYLNKDKRMGKSGYTPLSGLLKKVSMKHIEDDDQVLDPQKISYLEKFIIDAKKNNIYLIIAISPTTKVRDNNFLQSLTDIHNIEFWDYSNNPDFMKPEFFKDPTHMNSIGAEKYSNALAERIKNMNIGYGINEAILKRY